MQSIASVLTFQGASNSKESIVVKTCVLFQSHLHIHVDLSFTCRSYSIHREGSWTARLIIRFRNLKVIRAHYRKLAYELTCALQYCTFNE